MSSDRRTFIKALGSIAAVSQLPAQPSGKPYGSGHFGEWIDDAFGLPAFRYTCDQTKDPKAITPLGPGLLSTTEHIHQVGNDRLIAIVSNYGHVQVRQDEGSPKFLNVHAPERAQFGGGIGYLSDGRETLCTYYPGNAASFERIFGEGYFRKTVSSTNYTADQVILAPFGDDPVLLSQVTVTNRTAASAKLRWIEYWGAEMYQFSFRAFAEGMSGAAGPPEIRKKWSDRFAQRVRLLDKNAGLTATANFLGWTPEQETGWNRMKAILSAGTNPFLSPVQEPVSGASFDDLHPPSTFLVSLDGAADGWSADAKAFFGPGGAIDPSGANRPLDGALDAASALLLERHIELKPGESRNFHFPYGYLPAGVDLDRLVEKYRRNPERVLTDSSAQWRAQGMRFRTPSEPWAERETKWNYYYLRSSLTYDDFFGEHILSQGAIYQYVMGFQGAARDPLQHALPFLFSDPAIVKQVLHYTLKEVRADGSIPYAIVGHGAVAPMTSDNSSDMPLWLLWAVSEYVLATRDKAFLDERISAKLVPGASPSTVRELLARCYRHLIEDVGTGEHGLMRMLQDDWNDALVMSWAQRATKECVAKGESVLNSAMAAWVFDYYARLLTFAGDGDNPIADARAKAAEHRKAAAAQWDGAQLRRAWLGPTLGWLGEKGLWLEPQPWAIIGGVTTPDRTSRLVREVDENLRQPSPIGAMQMNKSADSLASGMIGPGMAINGGIWPSLNQTLIWALALVNPPMAWDEWKKNTFARHAAVYPDIWYGVWSGPDTFNSVVSSKPGETINQPFMRWADWPVMNLHSHACSLYSLARLLGVEFVEDGVRLRPGLPLESYNFESPLLGIGKSKAGYEGWYAPAVSGEWTLHVTLPESEAGSGMNAEINGKRSRVTAQSGGAVQLTGSSGPGKPLRWSLRP
jgi:hypothetical protein